MIEMPTGEANAKAAVSLRVPLCCGKSQLGLQLAERLYEPPTEFVQTNIVEPDSTGSTVRVAEQGPEAPAPGTAPPKRAEHSTVNPISEPGLKTIS